MFDAGTAGDYARLRYSFVRVSISILSPVGASMTSGRAQFTMQFDHYEPVPQNISDEIQKKYA